MKKNHLAYLTIWLPLFAADSVIADFVGSRKSSRTLSQLVVGAAVLCDDTTNWLDWFIRSGENLLREANIYILSSVIAVMDRLVG